CKCSFGIANERRWQKLPERLGKTIQRALRSYRETLLNEKKSVMPLLEKIGSGSSDKTVGAAAASLVESIKKGNEMPRFSLIQLQVLQRALGTSSELQNPEP